jgi:hypothetical protein
MMRQLRLILTMASEKLLPHSWAVPGQLRGPALCMRQLRLILTMVLSKLYPVKRTSFMVRQLRLILTMASEKLLLSHSWAVPGQLRGPAL